MPLIIGIYATEAECRIYKISLKTSIIEKHSLLISIDKCQICVSNPKLIPYSV